MLAIEVDRVCLEQVANAERLVHLVQMVHAVVGADHLAEVAAAHPTRPSLGSLKKLPVSASAGSTGSRMLVMVPRPLQEK